MRTALIGYTGLVGSNLATQYNFDKMYNSKNIEEIHGESFDRVICAGMYGTKWYANRNPEEDLKSIYQLMNSLRAIDCGYLVLISTVDVYKNPNGVDEDSKILLEGLHPYGRHRYRVEEMVKGTFQKHMIVRLPALFGQGLKKNFLYDMIHNQCLTWTHRDSQYQYYNLDYIWGDIQRGMSANLSLLNITSEPMSARTIAKVCFERDFDHVREDAPVRYDIRSKHSKLWGDCGHYMYTKEQVTQDIKDYISK